ncbi:MAG: methionyl-tRNA formyltransferase [Gammaproteobacteria bacterium]|nr:methionyl-tRNA formyltransferase [Gammaproteobacteria bacterium]NIP89924.1 methionyl-tRNA formyltransferase [Gammaproteobacteria bacterium]NIR24783.1 methionyl-tRNA formyltransferase [Gammaproteobacteria bacterium]NIS06446.1 methionyl-tRNA formyltransferase [Gammaproteobacteria bacterium]NIU42577.1 methionyl-tRNA formyltransferase [Gammaproteobacteria bacterium]
MGLRLIFAGTPEFAATVLGALLDGPHRVLAVYTQPDRPAGRGRRLRSSPVKALAEAHAIAVEQPRSLREADAQRCLARYGADAMIVAAYGLILPEAVLATPRLGCINVHASLLPRWRGAAPIQHAILAGDRTTGISIMQMDSGLDTGPVLRRADCPIHEDDTGGSLHDRLAALGAATLLETLAAIETGHVHAEPQDPALATYAGRIAKQDGLIEWSRSAEAIERQVRAFDPWPVAYTYLPATPTAVAERLRIWRARVVTSTQQQAPGTLLSCSAAGIDVATGRDALRIVKLQPAGGRIMSSGDYLNAHVLAVGARLVGTPAPA